MERPFKIRRLNHFGVDLAELKAGVRFYVDDLGFRVTDVVDFSKHPGLSNLAAGKEGPHLYFMSHNTDHHAMILCQRDVSTRLGMSSGDITINQLTWQVGSLREVVEPPGSYLNRRCRSPRA